jgi:hypothetical protein
MGLGVRALPIQISRNRIEITFWLATSIAIWRGMFAVPSYGLLRIVRRRARVLPSKERRTGWITSALLAYHVVLAVKDEREDALAASAVFDP